MHQDAVGFECGAEPGGPTTWLFDHEKILTERGRSLAIKGVLSAVAEGRLHAADGSALVGFIKAADSALPPEILEALKGI